MIATLSFMAEAFNRFNTEYFNNKLPIPTFELNKLSTALGQCAMMPRRRPDRTLYYKYKIMCSIYYDQPKVELENTMLHEMCHLWVFVNYPNIDEPSHGKTWQRIANSVTYASKGKYHITATSECDTLKTNDAVARNGYRSTDEILVYSYRKRQNNQWFVFAITPTRINDFDGLIQRKFDKNEIDFSVCGKIKRNELPNKYDFPLCRTRANGYLMSVQEYMRDIYPLFKDAKQQELLTCKRRNI